MADALSRWPIVKQVIEERRAVRDFDDSDVDDGELREILAAALLAPTSSNLQLFRLHVVKAPEKRAAVAAACMSQRAARGAPVLIAVAACPGEGVASIAEQSAALDGYAESPRSKQHARDHLRKIGSLVRFGPSSLWAPLLRFGSWFARWFRPVPLLPTGRRAFSWWAMRNSAFVAQTLMLAAQARGYASCPMEGFDPARVRRALGLAAEDVWLIIALGRRRADARIDLRWRRPFSTLVRMH